MLSAIDLVERGYFPRELPPPFSTASFSAALSANATSIPQSTTTTRSAHHSVLRSNALRRQLSVPNPAPYYKLAKCLEDSWPELINHCVNSAISLSIPSLSNQERAVVPANQFADLPHHSTAIRATSRFLLRTDINNYYPSIYTHSFSWALHTKAYAKQRRNDSSLLGNKLDRLVRDTQDAQTIGIPVSPDSSFILSEILLCSVDKRFCQELEASGIPVNGYRYVDDFEFGFLTRSDAEKAISKLEMILSEYELRLNASKTSIVDLPIPVEAPWASELRMFSISTQGQIWQLRRYFDRVFELRSAHPGEAIMSYAIGRLRSIDITENAWDLAQHSLLHCALVEPSSLPQVVNQLHYYLDYGYNLDEAKLSQVFNWLIAEHAPLGHGSEVCWSLWGCLLFKLHIQEYAAKALQESDDPFVALLTLHALHSSQLAGGIDFTNWAQTMAPDGLNDTQWLLAYEAHVKQWLTSGDGGTFISSSPWFEFMRDNDVQFYDVNKVASHKPGLHYSPSVGVALGGSYYP